MNQSVRSAPAAVALNSVAKQVLVEEELSKKINVHELRFNIYIYIYTPPTREAVLSALILLHRNCYDSLTLDYTKFTKMCLNIKLLIMYMF